MRISRTNLLHPEQGFIHKFWRCQNREFLLKAQSTKDLYMKCTKYALEHRSVNSKVKIYSYCLMDNHAHMQMSYDEDSSYLSSFMRVSHARFGYTFNKIFKRTGKVANERPKTPLIENPEHCMRVHFYIEANPVRANIVSVEGLKLYKYSSYRFFAHGIRDAWTSLLTLPNWYLALGKTKSARQSKYRKLFLKYLSSELFGSKWMYTRYIGNPMWQDQMIGKAKELMDRVLMKSTALNST